MNKRLLAVLYMLLLLPGYVSGGLSVFNPQTDANGVTSYDAASSNNGPGTTTLRVLAPTNPAPGVPHRFIYVLPVIAGVNLQDEFGDGLDELRRLNVHNAYNAHIIAPSFQAEPWYADHVSNPDRRYESFMVQDLVPWVQANLSFTGQEEHLLVGFSKSGFGAVTLLFRNPTVFRAAAVWDFPADQANTGDWAMLGNYGSEANFQNNYRLTSDWILAHRGSFEGITRLWLSQDYVTYYGFPTFRDEVLAFADRLWSQDVQLMLSGGATRVHTWTSGWLPEAVAGINNLQSAAVHDGFGRADGDLGPNWTMDPWWGSGLSLSGNKVVSSIGNGGASYWSAKVFGADQYSEVRITGAIGDWSGVMVRGNASLFQCYLATIKPDGAYLYSVLKGTFHQLVHDTTSWATGDVLRLEVRTIAPGTARLTVYRNGNQLFTYDDADRFVASGQPGIGLFATTAMSLDEWEGDDLDPAPPNQVAAFSFSEGSSNTTIDNSGFGHNGTLVNGPTWTVGKYGNGILFDGTNDYVSVASSASLNLGTSDFTIAAWVKRQVNGVKHNIISKTASSAWVSGGKEFFIRSSDNTLAFGGFGIGEVHSTGTITNDGLWHYVTVTFADNSNTFNFYIDGFASGGGILSLPADVGSHVIKIGSNPGGSYLRGALDEFQIFNRVLSQSEIQNIKNSAVVPPAPDATPPLLSNGQPFGTLSTGTTQATLSLVTDENATCRYSTVPGIAYAAMTGTFSTTGGTNHSTTISGLTSGSSYTYYVKGIDVAGNTNSTDFVISFSVAAPPPDTTPPTVIMTAPGNGPVSGAVTVSASASDNVGVIGVQFLLDGIPLGTEDLTAPYSMIWDLTAARAGRPHTLAAHARDVAGNETISSAVTVALISSAVPPNQMVALALNEASGTAATDSSGQGHNGTLVNGPTRTAGKYGNGLTLDGTNDHVTVANPSTLNFGTGDFTIALWLKRTASGTEHTIFSKTSSANWASGGKELFIDGGSNRLTFGAYGIGEVSSTGTITNDGLWHHVTVTFVDSTNTLTFYIDGAPSGNGMLNLPADVSSDVIKVGGHPSGHYFRGQMDEFRVFGRTLSPTEVLNVMGNPVP